MGALGTRKDDHRAVWLGRHALRQGDLHLLLAEQAHAGSTMLSATPILPEQGSRPHLERMEQDTDLAWLLGGTALPLTLLAEGAGTTTADTGSIHHP
jgi:hypothetical protein